MTPAALTTISRDLEQHPDALRIKKLLIYTTENQWESNPQQLQRLPLEHVVQKLLMQFTAIDQLHQAIEVAVSTLSRPAAYSQLANDILTRLSPLYEDTEDATQIVFSSPPPAKTSSILIDSIAHTLETHREGIRIKKLLYALCYQNWENNFQVLGQTSFVQLIKQMLPICSTYPLFRDALDALVASLNRQTTYAQIANFMLAAIAPLYGGADASTGMTRPTLTPPIFPKQKIPIPDYKITQDMEADANLEAELHCAEPYDKATIAINLSSQSFQKTVLGEEAAPAIQPQPEPDLPLIPAHFADDLNIYELKLEVMKYANPLRAKILLFSAVHHPFDLTGQDWSMLRTCDLDDLLRKVIRSSPSVVQLEIKLSAIAQFLFESEEHLQTTSAIIQAINLLTTPSKVTP